jgi:hypothetical protein
MKSRKIVLLSGASALLLSACASMTPPKYENGEYVPPPAKNPLEVKLLPNACGGEARVAAAIAGLVSVVGSALVNQAYDRFINWLDEKQANLSASSSGVATESLLMGGATKSIKQCLTLKRADTLEAMFELEKTVSGNYWHMVPYSLNFIKSEAKEEPDGEKSIVADVQFATPGADGKASTFFQATFDLGRRKAGGGEVKTFVGQDSGPYALPEAKADPSITMKITASVIEHGQGRDWIRGVTDSLRDKENRDKILKPLLDAIAGKKGA